MGKTKDLGHLAHIVAYDTENHITVPAGITMHTNQLVASQAWVTTALGSYALSSSLGSYVPTSRTITINGTTYDLSANREWDITSMIYPDAGIPLSTGSAWGTSITNNSDNWNTAYGWGNHASAGYLTGITSTLVTNALGYTPVTNARTITINGTAYDLTANRSWTVTATETDTLATVTARGATTSDIVTFTSTTSEASVIARNDGSGTSWRGRIGHFNATADKSVWFATYNGFAVVGAHNNALTAWADLLVNCVNNNGDGGTTRLSASSFVGTNAIIHAGNIGSQSVSLSSQVTINYNNDSNSTYQLLWGSGNSVYGTAQVYVNPSSDVIYARGGYISPGNPWGTSDSAYFPNGITTAGGTNWVYGNTYIGNAPTNGSGVNIASAGSSYFRSSNTAGTWGYAGLFVDRNNGANNYIPWSFESEYGNHSWGIVARFHIQQSGADRPSIQFSSAGGNDRWSVGYCTASDWNFRITQNQGYRTDNSTNDGWGTERFRINTDGNTYAAIGGTLYANGTQVVTNNGGTWGINISGNSSTVGGISESRIVYGDGARASISSSNMNDPNQKSGFHFYYDPSGRPYQEWWNWMTIAGNSWQSSNNYSFQFAHAFHNDDLYVRRMTNGSAAAWRYILTDANYNNYAPTKTGGGASGTWGINISGSSSSTGNADTVDGYHESSFWRNDQNRQIGVLRFTGEGYDSGNGSAPTSYGIYQQGGAWSHPYPDLCIGFHTGIKIGAYYGYNGTRFYNNSDWATITASVNDGDNNFRGYYDIIAYASDKRLKHNIQVIDNAVDKVMKLTGMTYQWNDVGSKHGWEPDTETREVGVFAQEVQEVLPEAVKLAPFDNNMGESKSGENFLTVKYEKIVPLLIEAIKEQQKQIDAQDEIIEQLKELIYGLTK